MDWSKAKTILIVALIITNLVLGYFLFFDDIYANSTIEDSFIKKTEEVLNKKGIIIDTYLPIDTNATYNISVEYEKYDPVLVNTNFFNGQGELESKDSAFMEIYKENESITIINDKLIIYENVGVLNDKGITTLELAIKEAMDFLQIRGKIDTNSNDMELSYYRETIEGYYLVYTKVVNDLYIENSFTTFRIEKGGVRKMERTWLNVNEIEVTNLEIVSAPKAILELLSMEQVYNKTISDVSLCYYFDPERQDYFGEYQGATEGKAIPAWRVQFKDGYKVILDIN